MNPIPYVSAILSGPMVQYMFAFFAALGIVSLVVKGANMVWDGFSTTWSAFRTDVKDAKTRGISVLTLWKERINATRPFAERVA